MIKAMKLNEFVNKYSLSLICMMGLIISVEKPSRQKVKKRGVLFSGAIHMILF